MEQNLDENTRRELEQELQTEIFPGTEIMTDVGNHHFVKSSSGEHSVLVPQPSDAENDPLNWTRAWKFSTIYCALLCSLVQGIGPIALAPMFPYYMKEFHSSLADVVQLTGITILVLGFSNFIWVPIQSCFGRRPVMVISTLICLASSIWKAKATSYGSFLGACVLNGIGAGPCESTPPTIIADVVFLHDRGKYETLYFAVYFGALQLGPILSGHMAEYAGLPSFWWLNAALQGFAVVCFIFLLPETKFRQGPVLENTTNQPTSDDSISDEKNSNFEQVETKNRSLVGNSDPEKEGQSRAQGITPAHSHQWLTKGKPSKSQWKLFQPYEGNFLLELWLPWKVYFFPIVQFAALVVAWSCSASLTLNLTQSQVFTAPPYKFSSSTIGFFNFAIFVGVLIGLFTAGPLSDLIAKWLTKRNNGIREPEMRLPAMIPYIIIMIIGNVIVALAYEHSWNWKITVIIGYTCAGIQLAALPSIASTYAVDSYKPVTGPLFVAITINKNLWGYGFSKYLTEWTLKSGYITPIMTNMALITLWCLCGLIFWFWGKTFRKWTSGSKVHAM
ncbi:major facilitator superfamily domain-containing protein [Talaromyces proteolyticus]|uniref:Major facilitator superfamily domain-containing protein n=1 Tax=Talaromyces proteolyticus TaxID=1131652 RepID=A0AAD4L4P0_9EURO|nr:major facilitator superfamily domain-containing protein [Talaromyces proteolyticus]KAH8705907.1 major facilitator superfamily domain-containing protein [Talaromyces proteolyticus]